MPNNALSVASVLEKNKLASGVAFLLLAKIEIFDQNSQAFVETIYVVNNNENIVVSGHTYIAFPFTVNLKYDANSVPQISLSAVDYARTLLGKLNQYGGASGSRVTIAIANSGNLSQGPEVEEVFEIIGASASDFQVTLTLGAESILTRQFPRRNQLKDRCTWRYKSVECGYTGGMSTCDLSLQGDNGCAAHNNTLNFGGFPSIQNRGMRYG